MHVILGGRYQGKRAYAYRLYGSFKSVCDLEHDNAIMPGLVVNVHLCVKRLLDVNADITGFFTERLEQLRECVIICEEIGSGVVPVEKSARLWRDETGRIYQLLAGEADIVDRVFAGLSMRLKGD